MEIEDFRKLYETVPKNLQDLLNSEEVGTRIEKACGRVGLDDKYFDIMNKVIEVLLGLLPVDDFEKVLIRDLGINISHANQISREIIRFIFFPVKDDIASLYSSSPPSKELEEVSPEDVVPEIHDRYREQIE